MLIRYGYEIEVVCARPTPLICMMSVQADRLQDLCMPETATATPFAPMSTYHDSYGNLCRRLVAPAGEIVLKGDATIRDGGGYDPVFPHANESPVEFVAQRDTSISAGKPLLRNRQAKSGGLGPFRSPPAGVVAGSSYL